LLAGWSLSRSLKLLPLRMVYFGILVLYASTALAICRLAVDWEVVLSTVPLVVLADGLPSFASLGSREAMLHLTLAPGEHNATLVAMSLMWSVGMIVGRLLIATVHMWLHRWRLSGGGLTGAAMDTAAGKAAEADAPILREGKRLRRTA
jgi:hypothetical protein